MKKDQEEPLSLEEENSEAMASDESSDSTQSAKADLFIHKENGKRVGFLGAQRIADGDKGKRWENEDETRARLTPVFQLDIQEAIWDDNPSQPGLRAVRDKPARKRPSAAARRRKRKADASKAEEPTQENEDTPDPVMGDIAEVMDMAELEDKAREVAKTAAESEDEPEVMDAELQDEAPEPMEQVIEKDEPEQVIEKSVDGERVYDLSGDSRGKAMKAIGDLGTLLEEWTWEFGVDALKDKVLEETKEFMEGGNEAPVKTDGQWTFIGTSAASEALTLGIVALKFLFMQGVPITDAIRLMQLRHQEQYDRYHDNS
jgi:hypothetical protein